MIAGMMASKYRASIIQAATTGIAATLLDDGTTVHSAFKIPINVHEESTLELAETNRRSKKARSIMAARIILID